MSVVPKPQDLSDMVTSTNAGHPDYPAEKTF